MILSADGYEILVNQTVWIRIGNQYPRPGVYRCRKMVVAKIKRTSRLVLAPTKGRTGCERMPKQVFATEQGAKQLSSLGQGRDGLPIMPYCTECQRRKAPRGRSVAPEAAGGLCDRDCPGYGQGPHPSSYWRVDEPPLPGDS